MERTGQDEGTEREGAQEPWERKRAGKGRRPGRGKEQPGGKYLWGEAWAATGPWFGRATEATTGQAGRGPVPEVRWPVGVSDRAEGARRFRGCAVGGEAASGWPPDSRVATAITLRDPCHLGSQRSRDWVDTTTPGVSETLQTDVVGLRVVTTLGGVDVVRHAAAEVMGLRVVTTTLGRLEPLHDVMRLARSRALATAPRGAAGSVRSHG